MGGSNNVEDWGDSNVNYKIAEHRIFLSFLNLNKFFIKRVIEISSYQYLRKDSRDRKTITDSFTQFHHLISDYAFWNKIDFLDYLINQKQVIAVGVDPSRHSEISLQHSDRKNCVSLLKRRHADWAASLQGSPSSATSSSSHSRFLSFTQKLSHLTLFQTKCIVVLYSD